VSLLLFGAYKLLGKIKKGVKKKRSNKFFHNLMSLAVLRDSKEITKDKQKELAKKYNENW